MRNPNDFFTRLGRMILLIVAAAIAMLAARDWTTQEIAQHLKISVNTVKTHISEAMRKLNVQNRKDLKQYMLL